MADEKQKTADEIRAEAAKRKALEALAAFAPAPAAPAGAPAPPSALVWQVPVPKADVPTPLDEAQQFMDLLGALEQRQAELQHGSTTGTAAKAGQMAEDAGMSDTGRPPPLPAERSWTDQFLRTFGQQVVREDQAPASLWDRAKAAASAGVDMVPVLRVMENPTLQALQARTQQFRDAKSDGTALGNVSAGLQRGVSRSIDALVPDNTTGEALTGVRTTGGVEVANALGQGLEGIGRDLQAEVAGADPGLFASQKAKAGLALGAFGRAGQLPAQAVDSLNTFTGHQRPAEPGMSGESGLLTLLRPATLPMAMAAEAAKAMPVPLGTKSTLDALGLRKDLRPPLPEDASLLDKAKRFAEPVTLGEMAGVPAGSFQQIDRSKPSGVDVVVPAPLRNYTQAVLERIEKQQGLEAEGEAIATQLGGKEWARTGWVVGAIADAVLEPERMGAAVLGKGAKLARRTAALGEVAPELTLVQRAMQAASQPTVEAGKVYGGQFVEALRSGQATLDDLPPGVREHADDIAAERRVLLEEQMALDGLAPMPRTMSEGGRVRQAEEAAAAQAEKAAAEKAAAPAQRLKELEVKAGAAAQKAEEARRVADKARAKAADGDAKLVAAAEKAEASAVAAQERAVQMRDSMAEQAAKVDAAQAKAKIDAEVAQRTEEAAAARAALLKGSPVYVVRNALEDELHVTENLDEALDWMRSRGIEGDRVWDDTAPVAVWRTDADGSRLAPGAKARGYNGVVVADVAGKHPPQQLRSLFSAEQREVGQAAASAVSGLPAGAVGDLPSEQIIRDAYNRWALDRLGTDELTFLPNGAQVSHADRARIMRQVDGDLGELGMAPPPPTVGLFGAKKTTGQVTEGADVAMIGRQLTDDERVKVARLAAKYRMTSTPDVTTTKGLRAFRQAAIEYHGGALASAKSAVKGKPGLADMLQTAVETFNTDRAVKGKMALAMRPLVAPFLDAFFSNPTAGLSPAGRSAILRGRSRLERLADEVLGGLKAEIGQFRRERGQLVAPLTQGQMAEVYRRVLGDDVAVVAADMARVRELRAGEAVTDEAIKRIASEVALPRWATTDDLVRRAVSEWAARKEADAASWAADYLRAMAATGGLGVKPGDAVSQYIMKNRERLLGVYDEVFLQGRFDGPTVVDTFAKLGAGPAGTKPRIAVSSSQAMLAFLVTRRRAEVLNDTLEELKHAGLVVTKKEYDARGLPSGAANPHVFAALLAGTTTAYKDGSVVELYAPGARAWARRRAARMGIEPGAGPGEDLVAMSAGGTTFMVPRYLEQRLMSSLTAGKVSPQGLDTPTALTLTGAADAGAGGVVMQGLRINDSLMRTWKALQTSGAPLLPRSLHVMAQGLGVLQSTWTTRGVVEAIKSAADVGKSLAPTKVRVLFPDIVSQMMGRLVSGSDGPAAAPLFGSRRFLRDVNGQLHSVEDLTAAARDYGLGDTLLSFETARHLESLLFSEMTVAGRAMFGPAAYTEMVTDYIGGFDQAARLSTFLREVERGTPLADAAKLARQSALDFRDLTNFEATWMRRLWTWYALQRKTADTLVREIVRNPGRVTSQMRAAHNLATDGLTAEQQGALTERDVSSIWLWPGGTEGTTTEAGVNGQRVNPRWYWRARTPPVQIPEFLSNLAFFLAPPAVGAEEYAGAVNPLVDMATIAVAGQKTLGTGQDVDLTRNAVVPPVFLHVPFGGAETLVDLFDIAPVSLRSPDLERSSHLESDPTAEQALGEPAVWVVGAGDSTPEERTLRRRMWAEFMLFFAGQAKTATGYGRAAGALPPRQDLTWEQEALFSVGIEMQRLPTTQETIDQFRIGRAGERKAETRAQEGMTGE